MSSQSQAAPSASDESAPARSHFTVRAVCEPSVLSRVVELFVLRDLIPARVNCEANDERLTIEVVVDGMAADRADHVAQRIRQFPTVDSVLLRRED